MATNTTDDKQVKRARKPKAVTQSPEVAALVKAPRTRKPKAKPAPNLIEAYAPKGKRLRHLGIDHLFSTAVDTVMHPSRVVGMLVDEPDNISGLPRIEAPRVYTLRRNKRARAGANTRGMRRRMIETE